MDLRLKESRKYLFNREDELENQALGSSALKVALNELENGVYIDVRELYFRRMDSEWYSNKGFWEISKLYQTKILKKVIEALKRVKRVITAGVIMAFEGKTSLLDVLNALNDVGSW